MPSPAGRDPSGPAARRARTSSCAPPPPGPASLLAHELAQHARIRAVRPGRRLGADERRVRAEHAHRVDEEGFIVSCHGPVVTWLTRRSSTSSRSHIASTASTPRSRMTSASVRASHCRLSGPVEVAQPHVGPAGGGGVGGAARARAPRADGRAPRDRPAAPSAAPGRRPGSRAASGSAGGSRPTRTGTSRR